MLLIILALFLILGKSAIVYFSLLIFLPFILAFGNGPYRTFSRFLIYDYLQCEMNVPVFRYPVIYVCNYPSSWMDYFVPGIFPENICILGSSQVGKYFARLAVPSDQVIIVNRPYTRKNGGQKIVKKNNGTFEQTLKSVREKTSRGFSVMCYVDSSSDRKHARDIGKLYHGMFAFSKILNIPIQPIALDPIRRTNFGHLINRKFWMNFGRLHVVKDEEKSMEEVKIFLQHSLELFIDYENGIKK